MLLNRRFFGRRRDTDAAAPPMAFVRDDSMVRVVEANMGKPLGDFFKALIAAKEGVPPAQVDVEYIRRQRETHVYPTARYEQHSSYGGSQQEGLESLTRDEIQELLGER